MQCHLGQNAMQARNLLPSGTLQIIATLRHCVILKDKRNMLNMCKYIIIKITIIKFTNYTVRLDFSVIMIGSIKNILWKK